MKIGIETSCLDQTIRGIGYYTKTLLEALVGMEITRFSRKLKGFPFSGSIDSLFRAYDGVDLLHFPEPKILYGKRPKCPFVLTIHDVMPLKFPHYFPKKHTLMMRYFLPRYLKEASAIICVSETTRKDLIEFFPKLDPVVVPCALLPQKRQYRQEKDPFLLYIGSFEKRKNLEGIFSAYRLLQKQSFALPLVIVGKEGENNRLPKEIPNGVVHKGYVSEEEKQDLLERASLLIWPSLYEGFGLPLIEAMASGTPIVTSNCGACLETVQDAAVLVDPKNPCEIAEGMRAILENESLRDRLAKMGMMRAEHFSLSHLRDGVLGVYERIQKTRCPV